MSRFTHFACALVAVALCGCAVGEEASSIDPIVELQDTTPPADPPADDSDRVDPASDDSNAPLYFGTPNELSKDKADNESLSYTFELVKDAYVSIELERRSDKGPRTIGFTLYRIDYKDRIELGEAIGHDGFAAMALYTVHGGLYAIQLFEGIDPDSLVLKLSCNSGTCAPARQPNEVCGNAAGLTCDKGLVCMYEAGTCSAEKRPARCRIEPTECPPNYVPVCGCDGRTWGNECYATQAGVSVLHSGQCES